MKIQVTANAVQTRTWTSAPAGNVCVIQTLMELENAAGGSCTAGDFMNDIGFTEGNRFDLGHHPVTISRFLRERGFNNMYLAEGSIRRASDMQEYSNRGNNVVMVLDEGNNAGHWSTIQKIEYHLNGNIFMYGRPDGTGNDSRYNFNELIKQTSRERESGILPRALFFRVYW